MIAIDLGNVPTWIAGIGTVGTLIAALAQIRGERKRREALEETEATSRKEAQARLIAAWAGRPEFDRSHDDDNQNQQFHGRTPINLINSSDEPVYSLVAAIVFIQGAAYHTTESLLELHHDGPKPITTAAILPPGSWRIWIPGSHWSGILSGRSGAELAFTDRASA